MGVRCSVFSQTHIKNKPHIHSRENIDRPKKGLVCSSPVWSTGRFIGVTYKRIGELKAATSPESPLGRYTTMMSNVPPQLAVVLLHNLKMEKAQYSESSHTLRKGMLSGGACVWDHIFSYSGRQQ